MQKEHQPYNIQPADRLANVSEYYFSRKLKEVAQMNAEGKNVISLGIGSPDMPPSEETVNVLCEQAKRPDAHGYQPTVGIPELRKAMADWYKRWYHVELDPATEIQPLIGSKEGILHVTLALVNPGDQVLVPNPGYPTYTSLNKILGSEIVNYNLREDNHWQPDFDEENYSIADKIREQNEYNELLKSENSSIEAAIELSKRRVQNYDETLPKLTEINNEYEKQRQLELEDKYNSTIKERNNEYDKYLSNLNTEVEESKKVQDSIENISPDTLEELGYKQKGYLKEIREE